MSLLQMSLSGSCIILIAALLRRLALHRLPKRMFLLLWMIAALRMLLPFEFASGMSVFALFARPSAAKVNGETLPRTHAAQSAIQMQEAVKVDWMAIVWLAGMLACALFFAGTWIRSMRRFRGAQPVQSQEINDFLLAHPLRRSVRVLSSGRISMPLTYGLLHPVILLPEQMDVKGIELILCHEWVHIRRFDGMKKLILIAAVCVHWFNPLAWLMLSLANRDIELVCDEQVLDICRDRRSYATLLIAMEEALSFSEPMFNHFAQNQTEERIVAIMKRKSKSVLSMLVAALIVLGSVVGFATTAPETGENLYAEYEAFGLVYDESDMRLYFDGQLVRYFEDMYPTGEDGECAGIVFSCSDGDVDVHAVRDLSEAADGSSNPAGVLIGVEAYSQAEFDARTEELQSLEEAEYRAERTVIVTSENGEVEYVETHPEESDGPTSVFISGEDGEYTFSLNGDYVTYTNAETVDIIGGADGPTSIYISADAEQASDGSISPEAFAEYAAFGLSVENDALYYENQRVRTFSDTYKVDFFRTVSCEHNDEEGLIDVIAIRDGSALIGLEIVE